MGIISCLLPDFALTRMMGRPILVTDEVGESLITVEHSLEQLKLAGLFVTDTDLRKYYVKVKLRIHSVYDPICVHMNLSNMVFDFCLKSYAVRRPKSKTAKLQDIVDTLYPNNGGYGLGTYR